jgi:Ca2+-binding RTX toxin-like protein
MRAQAHTLEGVSAAIVVVLAVVFALQSTAVTPLTASTASQHIETQHERAGSGLLETARSNGDITETLLYWNASGATFRNADDEGYYIGEPPDTAFGQALNETFDESAVAYNVNVYYVGPEGNRQQRRVVYHGEPSSDAVAATRVVTLYDDQTLTGSDTTVENASYFEPRAPETPGPAYAVVEVEVVVWRM